MPELRVVEKQVGDKWVVTRIQDLVKGDTFRMFEPDTMEPVVHESKSIFVAVENPTEVDGVYGIVADDLAK